MASPTGPMPPSPPRRISAQALDAVLRLLGEELPPGETLLVTHGWPGTLEGMKTQVISLALREVTVTHKSGHARPEVQILGQLQDVLT